MCEKMQKKCKKMQKNLRIWDFFCNFAADFGIVRATTIKYNRVMKKKSVIFRAEGAKRGIVHVMYVSDPRGNYYEVMRKRKRVSGVSRYWTLTNAMQAAVELCTKDIVKAGEGGML